MIEGLLTRYLYALSLGEDDNAAGLLKMVQGIYLYYNEKIGNQQNRIGLPPISEMNRFIMNEMMNPTNRILVPEQMARLRTLFPSGAAPATNVPPANPAPPK